MLSFHKFLYLYFLTLNVRISYFHEFWIYEIEI